MRKLAIVVLAVAACAPVAPTVTLMHGELRGQLQNNGLRFVIVPDPTTPLVEVDVRYEVGAREAPVFVIELELPSIDKLDECLGRVWRAASNASGRWDRMTLAQLQQLKERRKVVFVSARSRGSAPRQATRASCSARWPRCRPPTSSS